jgi:ribose-phosphate pyrophosphokinase
VAKRRTSDTTVEATSLVGEVEGRDILLVDDMTETAGTLVAAAELLKKNGARSVRALVSHCMLQEVAYDRLRNGPIDEVITTNTVPVTPKGLPITVLSVAPLLADAIKRIHGNSSVTDLFKIKGF